MIFSEISVLQRAEHDKIVKLVEILEDSSNFYLGMELLEGRDLAALVADSFYNERDAAKIIKQVLEGLNYLHKLGIVHRDIKLANVVKTSSSDDNLQVKIVDMGFSVFQYSQQEETDFCGSAIYMAPEILLHRPYD